MKKNLKIITSTFIFIFLIILLLVITQNTKSFDSAIYNFLISYRCSFLDSYFKFITMFGNTNMIIIVLGILILAFRNKNAIILTISTFSCVIVNSLVKHLVRRTRPTVKHLIKQGGFSFPSGHTMIAICLYGYLLYLVQKNIKNKLLKNTLSILLIIFILSIATSRIYVGVHYATDVIAGLLLGTSLLIIIISYSKKIN